jgi:hypothetical protein
MSPRNPGVSGLLAWSSCVTFLVRSVVGPLWPLGHLCGTWNTIEAWSVARNRLLLAAGGVRCDKPAIATAAGAHREACARTSAATADAPGCPGGGTVLGASTWATGDAATEAVSPGFLPLYRPLAAFKPRTPGRTTA